MLDAQNITKLYGHVEVLKGIDFKVKEKEVVAILGASGAGKSTLLHILATLDTPDSGSLYLKGECLSEMKGDQLATFRNQHIGFVFQFHQLLPEFTTLENVCMPGYLGGQGKKEVEEKAQHLLKILKLGHRLQHKPSELSGGELQRTAVARALINEPAIVFADEPSGSLDAQNAAILHQLLLNLRDELGQTFVFATHNESFSALADRQCYIEDGRFKE